MGFQKFDEIAPQLERNVENLGFPVIFKTGFIDCLSRQGRFVCTVRE